MSSQVRYLSTLESERTRANHWRYAAVALAVLAGYLGYQNWSVWRAFRRWKGPAFVFEDAFFHSHAVDYVAVHFNPKDTRFENVTRAAMQDFTRYEMRRKRATVSDDLLTAEAFMAKPLASQAELARYKMAADFIKDSAQPDMDVLPRNSALGSLVGCGYKGEPDCSGSTVDFTEQTNSSERLCSMHVTFRWGDPDAALNDPIGLKVTGFWPYCGGETARR